MRTNLRPYPPQTLKRLQAHAGWLDDAYDKIPVERAVLSSAELPGTVLRPPMIYGPGDWKHRQFWLLKRMLDGRRKILLSEDLANWRSPRSYVENVAGAIALVAASDRAARRTYNLAEEEASSELEWARLIAKQMQWNGEFVVLPRERTPKHLLVVGNLAQHWVASSKRIREELSFAEIVPRAEAIRRTVEWERSHPPEHVLENEFDYAAEDAALATS